MSQPLLVTFDPVNKPPFLWESLKQSPIHIQRQIVVHLKEAEGIM
jgi:hypothetical protein